MKEPKDLLQTSYCQAPQDAPRGPTTMCEQARKQNKTHYNFLAVCCADMSVQSIHLLRI